MKSMNYRIQIPDIPKLCDSNNYWSWRIILIAFLDAVGLWSDNGPTECPQSKFIILSTLEMFLIVREYETLGSKDLFRDLEARFTVKPRGSVSFKSPNE